MPLTHITCPDGVDVPIGDCFAGCRIADQFPCRRCVPLPILKSMFANERVIRPGVYSTTELIAPTRVTYLSRTTGYAASPDGAHFRTYGTAMHHLLENFADEHLAEVRLSDPGDPDNGGGQIDLFDGDSGVLMDLKVTGAYKVEKIVKAGHLASGEALDWAIQVNRYRQKLERIGFDVKRMVMVLMVRDWDFRQRKSGLPKIVQAPAGLISDRWLDAYFRLKRDAIDLAFNIGYTPPCRSRDIWGGSRCKRYCEMQAACRAMCEDANEPHPAFGWAGVQGGTP